jgi:hypothetical protein
MTSLHLFRPAKARAPAARRDRSAAVVLLMMALVFAPVVGMHFAASLVGSGSAAPAGGEPTSA